jgi:hypothetical protein
MAKKISNSKKKISDQVQMEDEIDNLNTKERPSERPEDLSGIRPQSDMPGNNNKDQNPDPEKDDSM